MGQGWDASNDMEDIIRLQLELSKFSSSLPNDLKLSDRNIARWLRSPEQQAFTLLHSLYCTTHIDLYEFSLSGLHEAASSELLQRLPQEFVLKSQKQAIAYAITLARFWETMYKETSSAGRVLMGDYNIAESMQQCIKILIIAKQHTLYKDLSSHSTAPLWRNEPVNEESIQRLVNTCVQALEPWSQIIPSVKPQVSGALRFLPRPLV